jgi:hypothetical protein
MEGGEFLVMRNSSCSKVCCRYVVRAYFDEAAMNRITTGTKR